MKRVKFNRRKALVRQLKQIASDLQVKKPFLTGALIRISIQAVCNIKSHFERHLALVKDLLVFHQRMLQVQRKCER